MLKSLLPRTDGSLSTPGLEFHPTHLPAFPYSLQQQCVSAGPSTAIQQGQGSLQGPVTSQSSSSSSTTSQAPLGSAHSSKVPESSVPSSQQPLIGSAVTHGPLRECCSQCSTALLPARRPHSTERQLVPDGRAISPIVMEVHPRMENPHTLLTTIEEKDQRCTVLDLKDACFYILLDTASQTLCWSAKTPKLGGKHSGAGLCPPRALKIAPSYLGIGLLRNWRDGGTNSWKLHCARVQMNSL